MKAGQLLTFVSQEFGFPRPVEAQQQLTVGSSLSCLLRRSTFTMCSICNPASLTRRISTCLIVCPHPSAVEWHIYEYTDGACQTTIAELPLCCMHSDSQPLSKCSSPPD